MSLGYNNTSLYSNQNRENQYHPYFTTLGNRTVIKAGSDQVIAAGVGAAIVFDTVYAALDVPCFAVNVNLGTGVITFLTSGVFSINASMVVQDASNATGNPVCVKTSIANSASGAVYSNKTYSVAASGATGTNGLNVINDFVVSYFQPGDSVTITVTNLSPSGTSINVKGGISGTILYIAQLQ